MARGRKPDSAAVKRAKGNPGRRPVQDTPEESEADTAGEAEAQPVESSAPAFLEGKPRELWDLIAPDLIRLRFVKATDFNAFARYCVNLTLYADVQRKVQDGDLEYETESRHGKMRRETPSFRAMLRLDKVLTEAEDRFGLNPVARQQLLLRMASTPAGLPLDNPNAPKGDDDPAAKDAPEMPASPIGLLGRSQSVH